MLNYVTSVKLIVTRRENKHLFCIFEIIAVDYLLADFLIVYYFFVNWYFFTLT